MNKYFVTFLLLIFNFSVFSQDIVKDRNYYQQKSKKQKKVAWMLLGGGATLVLTGIIIPKGESKGFTGSYYGLPAEEHKNDGIKAAIGLSGVLSMAVSIPVFIVSGKNKKRAMAATTFFKMEKAPDLHQGSIIQRSYPSIAVKINLKN